MPLAIAIYTLAQFIDDTAYSIRYFWVPQWNPQILEQNSLREHLVSQGIPMGERNAVLGYQLDQAGQILIVVM